MIDPPPAFSIAGAWCFAPRKAEVRLTASASLNPFRRHVGAGPRFAKRAGIVEGDVEPAEALGRSGDEGAVVGLVADVAGQGHGLAAGGLDLGDERRKLGLPPRPDHHLCAFRGEQPRGDAADAGARAGDDGDLVGQTFHFAFPFLRRTNRRHAAKMEADVRPA